MDLPIAKYFENIIKSDAKPRDYLSTNSALAARSQSPEHSLESSLETRRQDYFHSLGLKDKAKTDSSAYRALDSPRYATIKDEPFDRTHGPTLMKLKEAATGDLSGGQQYHEALKYGDVPLLPSFEPHSDDNIYRSIATTIEGKPNDYILPGKVENPVTFFTNASKVNSYHANAGGAGPKTEIQYTPDIFEKTAITDRGDSVIPNTPQKIMDIKDSTYSDLRDEDKPLKIIQTQNTIHDVLDDTVLKSFNRAFPDISFDPGRNGFNPHNLVQIGNHPMFGKYKVMTLSADIIDHLSKTKNPLYDTGFKLAKRDRKFNQHIKDITSTFPGASRADIEQLAFKATIMDYTELSMHENTIHNVPKNILGWIKQFKNYIANLVGANPNKLDSMTLQNLSEHILKDLASIGSLTKSTFK